MVHLVKTPLNAVLSLTRAGFGAVRHPLRTAGDLTALGRGLVATAIGGADASVADRVVRASEPVAQPAPQDPSSTLKRQGDPVGGGPEGPASVVDDGEDVEVVTPVGTTGAGAGYNPDTTETGLDQPGTEPLMDPSTTKRVKSETDTLRKAADRRKS